MVIRVVNGAGNLSYMDSHHFPECVRRTGLHGQGLLHSLFQKKMILSIQVFGHYCLPEDPVLAASGDRCILYSSSTILLKERWE